MDGDWLAVTHNSEHLQPAEFQQKLYYLLYLK